LILGSITAPSYINERFTERERGTTSADHSGQSPAVVAAAQANLRVVWHRFEGTPQTMYPNINNEPYLQGALNRTRVTLLK